MLSKDSRCGGELKELNGLNQLRENLSIKNLRHEKDTALECDAANLKGKQNLHGLKLEWIKGGVDDVDVEYDEMSLKHLQPHTSLKELEVQRKGISKLAFVTHKSCTTYVKCVEELATHATIASISFS